MKLAVRKSLEKTRASDSPVFPYTAVTNQGESDPRAVRRDRGVGVHDVTRIAVEDFRPFDCVFTAHAD
jgi:hypothetical protein